MLRLPGPLVLHWPGWCCFLVGSTPFIMHDSACASRCSGFCAAVRLMSTVFSSLNVHAKTPGAAAFSAVSCARDDSWISLSCGQSPELCKANDRQAASCSGCTIIHDGPPIPPDAPGGLALATRSGCCRPSLLVWARLLALRSRLRHLLPEAAQAQPALLPLPVAGPASDALL